METMTGNIVGKAIGDVVSNPEFKRNSNIAINEINKVGNEINKVGNIIANETENTFNIVKSELDPFIYKYLPAYFVNFYPKFHILCFVLSFFIMIILYGLHQIHFNKDDLFSEIKNNIIMLIFIPYIHILWLILKMAQHILIWL